MPWTASELKTLCTPEALEGETYDLVLPITYPYKKTPIFKTSITSFPSGMEQRVSYQTTVRNKFSLSLKNVPSSYVDGLNNFFIEQYGPMIPFKWIDRYTGATASTRYVRFNQESIDISLDDYDQWSCDFELVEVHSSEIIMS
jgi:hypothetical protein